MGINFQHEEDEDPTLMPTGRLKSVKLLMARPTPELGLGWAEEISRRVACVEAGQSSFSPVHETLAEMRRHLGKRRATAFNW